MSDFGEVRAILQDTPSASAFARLCALIDAWGDPAELTEQVLPYCASHLERWPDEARALPPEVAGALARGESPPMVRFARSATLRFGAPRPLAPALESGLLAQLRALRIEKARMVAADGEALAKAALPHLTSLHLGAPMHRGLRAEGVAALAPMLPRLEALELTYTRAGDEGVGALASAGAPTLTRLGLGACHVGSEGVDSLAAGSWPALASLTLSQGVFDDASLARLLRSDAMPELTELVAEGVPLGADALAGVDVTTLRDLTLSPPRAVDGFVDALPDVPWEALRLTRGDMSARGVRALTATQTRALTTLTLDTQRLGNEGAAALAEAPLGALRALSLDGNDVGAEGASALARAPWSSGLNVLILNGNPLGDDGVVALCERDLSSLRTLSLSHCGVGARGAEALASCETLSNLETLTVDIRRVDPRAVRALAASPHLPARIRDRWRRILGRW